MKADQVFNMAVLLILGALAFLMIFHGIPDSNRENVAMIIGAMAGFLTRQVVGHKEPQDVNVVNDKTDPVPVDPKAE